MNSSVSSEDQKSVHKWMQTVKEEKNNALTHVGLLLEPPIAKFNCHKVWKCMKEFTECVASFQSVFHILDQKIRSDKNVVCYCLGDGTRPQSAVMVAQLTAWRVYSIDPVLNIKKWSNIVPKRVLLRAQRTEDFSEIQSDATLSIILAVHSHADIGEFWDRIPGKVVASSIPCCVPQVIRDTEPSLQYVDHGIIRSGRKCVVVWNKNL